MEMISELYSIICDTYKTMNRTFDVPLEVFSADSQFADLGIDNTSLDIILMNVESRMNLTLPVDDDYNCTNVGDVITMIKSSK